jgi:hypothetical protein
MTLVRLSGVILTEFLGPMLFRQPKKKPPEKSNGAVAGRHWQTVEQQAESEKCGG